MFQSFDTTSEPEHGPQRLAALREEMAGRGVQGFLVPRADRFRGENVAPCDERLAWLTGFTGSAGFAAILPAMAGVFVDSRYRLQVRMQVADVFTPVNWPETRLGDWLVEHGEQGMSVAYDPWLHTVAEIDELRPQLDRAGIALSPTPNLVDAIWPDRPAPPMGRVEDYPVALAGQRSHDKRAGIAEVLKTAGQSATVLTLPDSIAWLLNIRGADIERTPVVHAMAIVADDGDVQLFSDVEKFADLPPDPNIDLRPWEDFEAALGALTGTVRIDKASAPRKVYDILTEAGIDVAFGDDPCVLPKACKTDAQIAATTEAHLRDGAAVCEFLAWLDATAPQGGLTEIDVAKALEGFRRDTNALRDISFDSIVGSGPNGAIVHYRVTHETNRALRQGELLLVDSGGQYFDGTTDITRTIAIGAAGEDERKAFTRVLKGMIAMSRARWPVGRRGRDLDVLARLPLWQAGQDYGHGTGHGVGVYLGVHEGPQGLSQNAAVPLKPGMILSNEPGYYREGAFGIRIENLLVVEPADPVPGGDDLDMLCFRTITFAPIDRNLVDPALLDQSERDWLNAYHTDVYEKISPRLSDATKAWLAQATRSI